MSEGEDVSLLYGLPIDEFTKKRDELAAAYKKQGEADAAKVIKALKKPTVVAWLVNQLAREYRAVVEQLLEASAQLASSRGREEVGKAQARRSEIIGSLVDGARQIGAKEGQSPPTQTMDKVTRMLLAATADESGRQMLSRGVFTTEIAPGGFTGASFEEPSREEIAVMKKEKGAAVKRAAALAKMSEQADALATRLSQEAKDASEAAEKARSKAVEARRHAAELKRQAEEASRNHPMD